MKKMLIVAAALIALTGCAGLSEREQRVGSGVAIGAAVGHIAGGGRGVPILIGGALGGLAGNAVDQNARADQRARDEQYERDRRFQNCLRNNSRRFCERNY